MLSSVEVEGAKFWVFDSSSVTVLSFGLTLAFKEVKLLESVVSSLGDGSKGLFIEYCYLRVLQVKLPLSAVFCDCERSRLTSIAILTQLSKTDGDSLAHV